MVNEPLTIGTVLAEQTLSRGDATLLICDDDRLTYADAERRSRELARGLLAHGASRGTHVGILFPTGVEFVVTWLAVARIGAVAVPISTFSTGDELRGLLADADIDVLIAVDSYRGHDYVERLEHAVGAALAQPGEIVVPAVPALRHVFVLGGDDRVDAAHRIEALRAAGQTLDDARLDAVEADVSPADRMVIVYTSGSTSAPKGVVHTHGALIRHVRNLNELRGLGAGVKLFSNSPLFWIGGLGYNVVGGLVAGATLICSTSLDSGATLDLIERERPDLVNGFVQSIANLVTDPTFGDRDFSSIRSGNLYPLLPDDIRPADPELRHNMLGMTETGSVCLMSPDERDQPERYRGSFGKPVPELEAVVVNPDTWERCEPGEQGELWFRGPLLMEGYYGRERHEVFTPDGWFRTGDQFTVDADGFFYFHGRRGDMIKTGGANVSPREVEAVLREVTGGMLPIVFGVDDPARGQIVVAVIVTADDEALDLDGLPQVLKSKRSAYTVPRRIRRLTPEQLPVLSSGKPDMVRLKELVGER
jgi:acyl-CoA synthetase (AMP-forming)/AMP-acid ligase II